MRGLVALALLLVSVAANAYVGPGLGLGVIGVLLGVLAAVFLAIVGVVWYPMKRLINKRKGVERATDGNGRAADPHERSAHGEPAPEKLQKSEI